jgi:hypothetical protein
MSVIYNPTLAVVWTGMFLKLKHNTANYFHFPVMITYYRLMSYLIWIYWVAKSDYVTALHMHI